MKHHSILTTLFPRLGFHNNDIGGLYELNMGKNGRCKPFRSRLLKNTDNLSLACVPDFLPPFKLGDRQITCLLKYAEVAPNHPSLTEAKNPALCPLVIRIRRPEESRTTRVELQESECSSLYHRLYAALENEDGEIQIILTIVTEKLANKNADAVANRTEIFAREVITAYRHFIECVLTLLLAETHRLKYKTGEAGSLPANSYSSLFGNTDHLKNKRVAQRGKEHEAGIHSTQEDAWRLLGDFGIIAREVTNLNLKLIRDSACEHTVESLDEFIKSVITNDNVCDGARRLVDTLLSDYLIPRNVGFKKCLEYFIYEEIPSI